MVDAIVGWVGAAVLGLSLSITGACRPSPPAGTMHLAGIGARPVIVVYRLPLAAPVRVLRPFRPPATPYGPGHLGVDLGATDGEPVRAAADGTVSFAGSVAGRGVVVLRHADGIRTEYEPVRPLVAAGGEVRAGQVVGRVAGRHPGCPGRCLQWGARRGSTYLDPFLLLQVLAPVRLLPWP